MSRRGKKQLICLLFAAAVVVILLLVLILGSCGSSEASPSEPKQTEETMIPNQWFDGGYYTQNGLLHYEDAPHLAGIDVSTHQGLIDWETVADSGVEFAIIRAGYRGSTEGRLYEDETFRYNLQGARAAGLQVGVYFFSQAISVEEAEEEAEYVCDLLEDEELDLPVFFDWEETGTDSRTGDIGQIPMTDCALIFCETVTAHGFDAGVYFNQNYGYHYLDLRKLTEYTLWLAEYNIPPTFEYAFDCLQYSDSGIIAGIQTTVDLNLLFLPEE